MDCATARTLGDSRRFPARSSWRSPGLRWLAGLVLLALGPWGAAAQTPVASSVPAAPPPSAEEIDREYAIKAAFLYNFARYVEWPAEMADSKEPFVIGLLEPEPFGAIIDKISSTKNLAGRPIRIERFKGMADYRPCHILFVAAGVAAEQKAAALRETKDKSVLLVGEEPGFAAQGAVVNFFSEENRIRFEINVKVAKQRRLQISSKLLTLGKVVEP